MIERCERQGGALTHASGEGDVGQDDEDADEKDLEDHQHAVDARGALDAPTVECGDDPDVDDDEYPGRGGVGGEEGLEVDPADDRVDHRQEQIVQQGGPADQEPDIGGVDHLGGVGVRRPGRGEDTGHPSVTERGEDHGDQRDDVGKRNHPPVGLFRHDAEGVEDGHRRHVPRPRPTIAHKPSDLDRRGGEVEALPKGACGGEVCCT